MATVEIVKVDYGPFGNPNRRGIESATRRWLGQGYELRIQEEIPARLFRRAHTSLTFVKSSGEGQSTSPTYIPAQKQKRKSSSGVGCVVLLIAGAVFFWPNIQQAIKNDAASRERTADGTSRAAQDSAGYTEAMAAVSGVTRVISVQPGINQVNGLPILTVSARVAPSALNQSTAEAMWREALRIESDLWTFGLVATDGERVFLYGYDVETKEWSSEDMTGLVDPD